MRYCSFNSYLLKRFGERVQKVTLDAGLGCPNRDGTRGSGGCIYCDRFGSGSDARSHYPDVRSQALAGMERLGRRYKAQKFIAYFQSFSNTYAPTRTLRALYDQAADLPQVVGLAVGTRPDCLTEEVLDLLASYTPRLMVWLELGLQSVHDTTLRAINRGHDYGEFLEGYQLARRYPLQICVHVIIGLPEEDREMVLTTARQVARLKPDGIKIHSLYVNTGTILEDLYRKGQYAPWEQDEFVQAACDFLEILPLEVVVQRLTGDPRPQELVAPQWARRKEETLRLIQRELEHRGAWQGKKYAGVNGK
jgi:uncharacterized protein